MQIMIMTYEREALHRINNILAPTLRPRAGEAKRLHQRYVWIGISANVLIKRLCINSIVMGKNFSDEKFVAGKIELIDVVAANSRHRHVRSLL